jgi:hypothetical protein
MAGRAKKKLLPSKATPARSQSKKHLVDARDATNIQATSSPARELMSRLAIEHAVVHNVDDGQWSARRSVFFIALTCSAMWAGLYFLARVIF